MDTVDTTDSSQDTKDRVAAVVMCNGKMLIGHAPNAKSGPNTWDLSKGHIEKGETVIQALLRELKEETNIQLDPNQVIVPLGAFKYKEGNIGLFLIDLKEIPQGITCKSTFHLWGRDWPEFSHFEWIDYKMYNTYLYKGLAKVFSKVVPKIEELI